LIQGDWEKFSDYTIHTMYPFGRIMYSIKKTAERPERAIHNFFRIPTDKIAYRIRREDIRESRAERIKESLAPSTIYNAPKAVHSHAEKHKVPVGGDLFTHILDYYKKTNKLMPLDFYEKAGYDGYYYPSLNEIKENIKNA